MNPSEMTTLTNTLEVFDTYKHREDKDSDEESFHLPLDDDESEQKIQDPVRNGNCKESEEEILNKFENTTNNGDNIDSQLEDQLLEEEEDKVSNTTLEIKSNLSEVVVNGHHSEDEKDGTLKANDRTSTEESKDDLEEENDKTLTNGFSEKNVNEHKAVVASEVCEKSDAINDHEVPTEKSSAAIDSANVEKKEISIKDSNSVVQNESAANEEQTKDRKLSVETQVNEETKSQENQTSEEKSEEKTDSNDFTKHNEDSEDLFDISIIRDAEEDNAESAFNETNSEENPTEENEEYDDKVDDDVGNEKIRSEEDEEEPMEIDKNEENLKNDDVDIEESNLNIDSDTVKDGGSDGESENCNKTDLVDVHSEQKVIEEKKCVIDSSLHCRLDEVTGKLIDIEDEETTIEEENKITEKIFIKEDSSRNSLKRSLSEGEDDDVAAKKTRTQEPILNVELKEDKPKEKLPLKTLSSLSEFMKVRKTRRLTMHDLEEFCLQKICEVIVHKSELGDVHHQLKLQEQLIETMRKEIQQLTKQARDLEIVNKKLLNDLKQQTTTQKPLNPLKITRSVGLQVKFTPAFEANAKRRLSANAALVTTKPPQTTPNRGARVVPNTAATTVVNRQVASPQKQILSKPPTPLLSQALQNRRANATDAANKTPNQQTRPKPPEVKNSVPASPSVIDLTDEDDKKDKNKNTTTKIPSPKSITVPLRTTPLRVNATTPGIRLTTTQGKVSPITSVVTSSTPQVMYVVQSSSQNALASSLGPKAVVVNFQSTNGVLTSTLNGSAVSVIPNKQNNTIQLKQVGPSKSIQNNKIVKVSSKHPAPLPPPPMVRVILDKPLKPIPPKPHLTIRKTDTGIILQWKMPYELDMFEAIASYQLYAYQETSALPSTDMWRKVGDVKALALPMACTLTQFADKNKYYFAVRPVDIHKRIGMFSEPEEISL